MLWSGLDLDGVEGGVPVPPALAGPPGSTAAEIAEHKFAQVYRGSPVADVRNRQPAFARMDRPEPDVPTSGSYPPVGPVAVGSVGAQASAKLRPALSRGGLPNRKVKDHTRDSGGVRRVEASHFPGRSRDRGRRTARARQPTTPPPVEEQINNPGWLSSPVTRPAHQVRAGWWRSTALLRRALRDRGVASDPNRLNFRRRHAPPSPDGSTNPWEDLLRATPVISSRRRGRRATHEAKCPGTAAGVVRRFL